MKAEELRSAQTPLKERYREAPEAALVTLRAHGRLGEGVSCKIETGKALVVAGLHPATGGSGQSACAGDMLLEALVACRLYASFWFVEYGRKETRVLARLQSSVQQASSPD